MIESGAPGRARVLVVDDEPQVLESIGDLLRREFHVYATADPHDALTFLRGQPVATVVADQRMPGLTGAELLSAVVAIQPDAVRVLLTGYADIDALIRAVNHGHVHHYVAKPWRPKRLLDVLRDSVRTHALQAETRRLLDDLRAACTRQRALAAQLLGAQEAERRRVAHALHDELGQALVVLKLHLERAANDLPAQKRQRTADALEQAEALIVRVRDMALDLRPALLDDLGLVPALRWYVERLQRAAGLDLVLHAPADEQRLAPEIESACFRIVQEALTNAVRHARARHVSVTLIRLEESLELAVRDDGAGFDVCEARARAVRGGSIGLLGMEERAGLAQGSLEIQSAGGAGTRVVFRCPLQRG